MKKLCIITTVLFAATAVLAQISSNDPSLRIWLKADTLTGTNVPVWADSSTNGLVMAAPALPPGDLQNDPDSHTPLLITANNGGKTFNAVRFRQANDPLNAPGHFADRLWQTNKLDASDPTLIDPSQDITMIAVYYNLAPNLALGQHQAIFCKRGGACPYEFGLDGSFPAHELIQYAGPVVFGSGLTIPTSPEWGIVIMNLTAGGTMTWTEYYASKGGWRSNTQTGIPRAGAAAGIPFTIAFHVQGAGGNASNPWGNGTYERFAGDVAELALYNRSLTGTELTNLQTDLLVKYFLNAGPPTIKTQPQSLQVNQYESASFSVVADGTPPFVYQWLKGSANIPGATGPSYTIPSVSPGDTGFYSVAVTNSIGDTNSQAAFLTVIADTNPPTISSALLNFLTSTEVRVTFSELVNPASATNKALYNINNSVTINDVVAIPQTSSPLWSNYIDSVVLTTTPITTQSTLTVNGVQDRGGNTSAAQATLFVPVTVGAPPTANRLLWLAADNGVLADAIGVYEWQDQAGAANPHNAVASSIGNAQVGLAAFPNALHPVVTFDGASLLVVQNQPDFNLQNFTVYVVGSVQSRTSSDWLGNWEGWTLGTSDGNPGVIKWVTHTEAGDFSMEPTSGRLGAMVPAYMVGTFANPGDKTLSLNGRLLATQTGTAPIVYTTARGLALGALFDDSPTQPLYGDIAEILIYSSVSAAQDAAVQQYLGSKYFSPSAVPLTATSAANTAPNTVQVRFTDTLDSSTSVTAGNYTINNSVTVSAASKVDPTTIALTTSALTPGQNYTLTVNGVKNWAGASIAPNTQVPFVGAITEPQPNDVVRIQDTGDNQLLVLEAERFSGNVPATDASWVFAAPPTYLKPSDTNTTVSGVGVMEAQPNAGVNRGTAASTGPRLDYNVYFTSTGTFYSWVRGVGDGADNDSVFIGIDGTPTTGWTGFPANFGYTWSVGNAGGLSSPIVVSTPGTHVINVWMREDGFAFDKLVLSSNQSYNPTGVGPAESKAGLTPVTITPSGSNLTLNWSGTGVLQSSTNAAGPFTDVLGASSPWPVTPTGVQQYYRTRH